MLTCETIGQVGTLALDKLSVVSHTDSDLYIFKNNQEQKFSESLKN